jgi:hypothetical protein
METVVEQQAQTVASEFNALPKANGKIVLNSAAYGGISNYLHFQANPLVDHDFAFTMVGPVDLTGTVDTNKPGCSCPGHLADLQSFCRRNGDLNNAQNVWGQHD